MRCLVVGLVIALLSASGPPPALAASAELETAFDRYEALRSQGNYAEAEIYILKALELGEAEFGADHEYTAHLINSLAVLYYYQGRYVEAEKLNNRSLAIREKSLGVEHPDTATSLNNLALVYRAQGRPAEAEPMFRLSLLITERTLGPEHVDVSPTLDNLAALFNDQGRHEEAEPLLRRSLSILEKHLGPEHRSVARGLNDLADVYRLLGRYGEAEPLLQRSLSILEKLLGNEHPDVATSLNDLALLYDAQGRYGEAAPMFERSITILEKNLGPDHRALALAFNNLAEVYRLQGRYGEAEPLMRRSLSIYEVTLGPRHRDYAGGLNNLALLYVDQGRYGEAEPLYKQSLAIRQEALGPEHPDLASSFNNLAQLYYTTGRYREAEPLFKQSLSILENRFGQDHPDVATVLGNLALLFSDLGRYEEAERDTRRALQIREQLAGLEHTSVAISLNNLAALYNKMGRHGDAGPLYERSLEIWEKVLGPEHPVVGTSLNNLAEFYLARRRYRDAEPLLKRSLAISEGALGPQHPDLATSLNNLAQLYRAHGRFDEAEPLYARSIAISEATWGSNHPDVATSLANLANLYVHQNRFGDAESLLERSLAIREKTLGPEHREVASSLNDLATLFEWQGRWTESLALHRRATEILSRRDTQFVDRSDKVLDEQKSGHLIYASHVRVAASIAFDSPSDAPHLVAETFEIGQLAQSTRVGAALARMAARFAAGDDLLAVAVRDHQDAIVARRNLDSDLVKSVSMPPDERKPAHEAALRARIAELDARIAASSEKLSEEFPDYAELTSAKPAPISGVQALLGADEALVAYLVESNKTFMWVLRADAADLFIVDVGREDLQDAVRRLRVGLDPSEIRSLARLPRFDGTKAYKLYDKIFAPAEAYLDGVRHVFVVPDGALQSIPLGVLLTKEPQGPFIDLAGYAQAAWLAKTYGITTLPSISSLRALRTFAKRTNALNPFTGIGDPLLEGRSGANRGVDVASLYRGAVADVDAVRRLAPLPETADELAELARAVGGSPDRIFLRERATETAVKTIDLSDSRIVAFATHGLVAGDLKSAEPALVLTPPDTGTELDDGLLTASEVAQLNLNADLVILSACNTAAGDGTDGAEGLSGLAKAFFYAGSRALLVSHWPVASVAAVKLTTRMLDFQSENPDAGLAEALRQSRLALINDETAPYYAHPIFWAPFVVVGEGGIATR